MLPGFAPGERFVAALPFDAGDGVAAGVVGSDPYAGVDAHMSSAVSNRDDVVGSGTGYAGTVRYTATKSYEAASLYAALSPPAMHKCIRSLGLRAMLNKHVGISSGIPEIVR